MSDTQFNLALHLHYRLSTERLRRDLHQRVFGDSVPILYTCDDADILQGVICVE